MSDTLIREAADRLLGQEPLLEAGLSRFLHHFGGIPKEVERDPKLPFGAPQEKPEEPEYLPGRPMAALSAYRTGEYTKRQNDERNEVLAAGIQRAGYGYMRTRGVWKMGEGEAKGKVVDEPGYTIVDIDFDSAKKFATDYQLEPGSAQPSPQEAFVWTDGHKRGMAYLTDDGQPVEVVPWTKFHVFTDPKDVPAGTLPSWSKTKLRGFQLTASTNNELDVRIGAAVPPVLAEEDMEEEPSFGIRMGRRKNGPGVAFSSPRFNTRLPMEDLCIVEVNLPPKFRAYYNMPKVSIGIMVEGVYYWLRNDGTVSCMGGIAKNVVRWAPLVVKPATGNTSRP